MGTCSSVVEKGGGGRGVTYLAIMIELTLRLISYYLYTIYMYCLYIVRGLTVHTRLHQSDRVLSSFQHARQTWQEGWLPRNFVPRFPSSSWYAKYILYSIGDGDYTLFETIRRGEVGKAINPIEGEGFSQCAHVSYIDLPSLSGLTSLTSLTSLTYVLRPCQLWQTNLRSWLATCLVSDYTYLMRDLTDISTLLLT